ncbi:MAG: methionyl-tRNA formyltransferase [Actinomycetia bacterium]|nr:methionyl-tRNA formyltransferase [Actinomycetes bacterium]
MTGRVLTPPETVRRIVYLGTPEASVPPLRALHEAGFEIPLVITRADTRRRRRGSAEPSPVKAAAVELGLEVSHDIDDSLTVSADLGVVVAFGRIIKPHVLDALAMVNIHFSLLPRWRGAAPVEHAVLAGDPTTGVCLMEVAEGLDTGGVYRQVETAIDSNETAAELRDRLVVMGSALLVGALGEGLGEAVPQVGEPVYAAKITTVDLALHWERSAIELQRVIRIGNAHTEFRGARFKVWAATPAEGDAPVPPGRIVEGERVRVATGSGWLELTEVQPAGKPRMAAGAWANGAQLSIDDRLGP